MCFRSPSSIYLHARLQGFSIFNYKACFRFNLSINCLMLYEHPNLPSRRSVSLTKALNCSLTLPMEPLPFLIHVTDLIFQLSCDSIILGVVCGNVDHKDLIPCCISSAVSGSFLPQYALSRLPFESRSDPKNRTHL